MNRLLVLVLATIPLLLGCGSPPLPEPFDEAQIQGAIDESASAEIQEKQDALIRLFGMINRGVPFDDFDIYEDDLKFTESVEDFYKIADSETAMVLDRWDWNGPTDGLDFPVKMRLLVELSDKSVPKEVERIYQISISGQSYTIRRK